MKIVIQCSGKKKGEIWTVSGLNYVRVKFVSNPSCCRQAVPYELKNPDELIGNTRLTWRSYLVEYNKDGRNPDDLLRAGDLYDHPIYKKLVERYGWENTFILSAGWGLVRADYFIPYYDITFSRKVNPCQRRKTGDVFYDFNHLNTQINENVYFFGGVDYLPLYYTLTREIPAEKVIFHVSGKIPKENGYEYINCSVGQITNWHYKCVEEFLEGRLNL